MFWCFHCYAVNDHPRCELAAESGMTARVSRSRCPGAVPPKASGRTLHGCGRWVPGLPSLPPRPGITAGGEMLAHDHDAGRAAS